MMPGLWTPTDRLYLFRTQAAWLDPGAAAADTGCCSDPQLLSSHWSLGMRVWNLVGSESKQWKNEAVLESIGISLIGHITPLIINPRHTLYKHVDCVVRFICKVDIILLWFEATCFNMDNLILTVIYLFYLYINMSFGSKISWSPSVKLFQSLFLKTARLVTCLVSIKRMVAVLASDGIL